LFNLVLDIRCVDDTIRGNKGEEDMRIRIPVVIDIPDEEIEKLCKECEVAQAAYREGLVEDKIEIVASLVSTNGFMVDDSKVTVE